MTSAAALLTVALLAGADDPPAKAEAPQERQRQEDLARLAPAKAKLLALSWQGPERGGEAARADLHEKPLLRWSNPSVGEIHGNVFLWTVNERPAAIGSLYKWFTPHTHMSHEFHSLAESPLSAKYGDSDVWQAKEAGVPVRVCGEMAGRPLEAMALIGIGSDSFSITPAAVGPVKAMVRSIDAAAVRAKLESLLAKPPTHMRKSLQDWAKRHGVNIG